LIFPFQVLQLRLSLGSSAAIILIHRSEKPFTGIKKYLQRIADIYTDAYLFTSAEFGYEWTKNGNFKTPKKVYEAMHGSSVFQITDILKERTILGITGSPVFLWVGRLDVNKDPLTVVKAFKKFLEFKPTAMLYMIYHTIELLDEINKVIFGVANIKLIGKVEHRGLQNWYNAADYIVSGSHYEGGGIAVCEAMSCGCIPIVTDIVSFRKITDQGKYGFLYAPGNVNELLEVLVKTESLNIHEEKKKVIEYFKVELSFAAIANKIDKVILSLSK
jgi:glycosyltransferase involved in cell wall biosynthesis